jgi:hypothetical protein
MDVDEAVEAAEEYFAGYPVKLEGKSVELTLKSVKMDGDVMFVKFAVGVDHLDDNEPSDDLQEACDAGADAFKEEFPEFEELPIEFLFVPER